MVESSFWYRPTRVVPDQRPLNGRCCCCISIRNGQPREPALCQLYRHTFVPYYVASLLICCVWAASTTAVSSAAVHPSSAANKDMLDNVRKCKNFLSTLLKLASNQPATTVQNVKTLIQGLVVGVKVFAVEGFISRISPSLCYSIVLIIPGSF